MSERKEYMNLAWEIATKLSVISDETRNEIFGCSDVGRIIRNNTPDVVNFKMIQYEKKLGEEKINVGDIVQCDYLSQGIVTNIICDVEKSEEYNVLFTDGVSESYTRDKLQKTGKTVDILKVLREVIIGWNARFKTDLEVIQIFDLGKIDRKIYEWVHEEPENINKIGRRALTVAVSPMVIGALIALIIIIGIIKVGGGLW